LDPAEPLEVEADLGGIAAKSAKGQTLTAPAVDSINTFETPHTVMPKPVAGTVHDGKLTVTVEPKSVTVISLEQ
jgi:alpha-N-arabinofuranosidase